MDDQTDVNTADPDARPSEGATAITEPATAVVTGAPGVAVVDAPAATDASAEGSEAVADAPADAASDAAESVAAEPVPAAPVEDAPLEAAPEAAAPAEEAEPAASAPAESPADRAAHRAEEQRRVDALWDFSSPQASVERFRAAADDDGNPPHLRAVFATQLARALGLAKEPEEAVEVLDAIEAEPGDGELRARVALERGRLATTSDRAHAVATLTYAAREAALAADLFLALDALHMLALIDAGHEEEWAEEGFAVLAASREPRVLRWGVALHNNLGWTLHDAGRAEEALARFEDASRYAERFGTAEQRHVARWAIGRCLRTLDRTEEALAIQQELHEARPDDGYVIAELHELGVSAGAPTIEA
ncbi:tetratricopeptide repeat protein [Agromyces archimandritae]|uniref:tetratricopeptide repeat protein n=1 Tax=Agromyces archimandritae TaxID=2781962 RepID=UPI001FD25A5F|nr:tetratricopeptide repeat protein [Agromyces archimandritae]